MNEFNITSLRVATEPDLLGLISILIVFLITFVLASRWPQTSRFLFVALTMRLIFLIINNYVFYLPDGDMDGLIFEYHAWKWSQGGFLNTLNYFNGPNAYFLSFLIAIPYSLFGRSFLMAQSFSIFFGIASVFLSWMLAKKIWNNDIAIKVGWTVALFPTLVSYSVLVMREVYITFFLLVAFYGIVKWIEEKNLKFFFLTVIGFISATFFHGGSVVGLFIFLIIVSIYTFVESMKLIMIYKIKVNVLMFLAFSMLIITLYITNKISFDYMGGFEHVTDLNYLSNVTQTRLVGDADFPNWTKINSNIEIFYKVPVRIFYFLFSPFPWDIVKIKHLIGLFDSILYLSLFCLIILNLKVIWNNNALRTILIILLFYFVAFSFGVGNFGTGIRHRSKFVIELILLAAPLIPKFVISSKKIYSNIINKQ